MTVENSVMKAVQQIKDKKIKIAFSFKIPKNLKDEIQLICEEENISLSSLLVHSIEIMIDEHKAQKKYG